jgi:phi13 family phage major tail protein
MANIGVLRPVFAKVATEPENAAITYAAGKALGYAMNIGVTYETNDAKLHAEGTVVESDNSVTGAELTVGVDDIADENQVDLLGTEKSGETGSEEYEITDASAPYVGVGYVEVRKKGGVISYRARWFHKVQFKQPDESLTTKGDKLEFQTPTIKGKVLGVYLDTTGKLRFRKSHTFTTLAAANAWLDTKAGISSGT